MISSNKLPLATLIYHFCNEYQVNIQKTNPAFAYGQEEKKFLRVNTLARKIRLRLRGRKPLDIETFREISCCLNPVSNAEQNKITSKIAMNTPLSSRLK